MTMTIGVDERDGLCEIIERQKGSLRDVWAPFAEQEWEEAERSIRNYLQDCRFLDCLRRAVPGEDGQISLSMRIGELREILTRAISKRTAQLVIEESAGVPTPGQELFQQRASVAIQACERSLRTLNSRFEVRYVVVDTNTGNPVAAPTALRDFAFELCDVFNDPKPAVDRCCR
jgi:hypothetical protein